MTFIVKRSEWARGEPTALLMNDGTKCCLGFRASALGIPDRQLRVGHPGHLLINKATTVADWRGLLEDSDCPDAAVHPGNYCFTQAMYEILNANDDCWIGDEEREAVLTKLFQSVGDDVLFV